MAELNKRFPIYSRLLKLYPKTYQQEYSGQMLQTLADMLDASETRGNRFAIWSRAMVDLPLSLGKQQLIIIGGVMAHETPGYVKFGSLAGGLMLLPFFLALTANGLNRVIYNHDLLHSWLWAGPALYIWVILLPTLALITSGVTFLRWSGQQRASGRTSSWKLLSDWQHNWMMLVILVISFGILGMVRFHDSMQCVTGNPIRELSHFHQTLSCINSK